MKHANVAIFVPHAGCPNQCSFCNQHSISGWQQAPSPADAAAVCDNALKQGIAAESVEIAFFGGSFTAIPKEQMCSLLKAVQPFIGEGKFSGIRISTRPDAIDEEILCILKEHHVTAIELGVQSMDDDVLQENRRGHTSAHVREAVKRIRQHDFELGLQFMPGLAGDSIETMWKTALAIADLQPDTVRIYPTLVLEHTNLAERYRQGSYEPLSLGQAVELCADFIELFERQNIVVIRVGLHAQDSMEAQLLAGPYHPAFREMCESRIYLKKAISLLEGKDKSKKYHLLVQPDGLSKLIGQGGENRRHMEEAGYNIKIKPLPGLNDRQIILKTVGEEGQICN